MQNHGTASGALQTKTEIQIFYLFFVYVLCMDEEAAKTF